MGRGYEAGTSGGGAVKLELQRWGEAMKLGYQGGGAVKLGLQKSEKIIERVNGPLYIYM